MSVTTRAYRLGYLKLWCVAGAVLIGAPAAGSQSPGLAETIGYIQEKCNDSYILSDSSSTSDSTYRNTYSNFEVQDNILRYETTTRLGSELVFVQGREIELDLVDEIRAYEDASFGNATRIEMKCASLCASRVWTESSRSGVVVGEKTYHDQTAFSCRNPDRVVNALNRLIELVPARALDPFAN